MNKEIIKRFAKKYMSMYGIVDSQLLQEYIKNRDEVGRYISANDISIALEEMAFDGNAVILSGNGIQRKYIWVDDYFIMRSIYKTIAIDVDDVVVDLVSEWLRRYNYDYEDNLKPEDIHDWEISKLVKPECGNKIFDYLEEEIYYKVYEEKGVDVISGAFDGIKKLRENNKRVVFVTAGNHPSKEQWLIDNGFLVDENDYVYTRDKSLVNAGVLLDDGFHNVKEFKGIGFLFTRPWNKKYSTWKYRVDTWQEFVDKILEYDKNTWR